jgi:hypothetical protein
MIGGIKTALVDDPSDLINTRRLSPGRKHRDPETAGRGAFCPVSSYEGDQVTCIIYSGCFLISTHIDKLQEPKYRARITVSKGHSNICSKKALKEY